MTAKTFDRILAVLGTLGLGCWGACLIAGFSLGGGPWPMPRPDENTAGPKFRVAVLGDVQKGLGNLAGLLEAIRKERVDLILQTGDLVAANDEGHYRLAALAFRRAGLRVPMAVVPGNHDIKGGPARFERTVGPLEQSFRRGRVFFVLLNNAFGEPPDPARVEAGVARAPAGDAVVLAMHVPPFDAKGNILPAWEPFVRWLERSRVRYLLCGQLHDCVRREIGSTVVIANGVGGDYESWELRQKVCAAILDVDGAAVTDRSIELPPSHGIVANLEHFAAGHLAEAVRARPWIGAAVTALLAAVAGIGFLRLRMRARRGAAGPGPGMP